ncbi:MULTISPECIES: Uma2 family endonuclease [unclassified Coleofasciculus]|uniref:Uma2 family endonuclease n=1 Tax=unclassified Coleofasciculus TaxID=2692782 RepID=UPI001881246C|nr:MULTISPECIES: Uma2 family endonuclease [unclassified Coleofasciculus]MBE9129753.1 Uma2 family endonuclease [Coleofasciculus sp. LEGE 07081]MBE9151160.1 Uma2 family endonuclease [Coleofasciculus sp. LEGE 07092]
MTLSSTPQIIYPESDGQPLADNTIQFRLIVTIQGGLDAFYKDNPNVFVAGDLFWYPVEGEPWVRIAPDVMVAMGRPKGDRRSYKQWVEGNIAPQVVFEIASKSNSLTELEGTKRLFYERYGVEEYYLFDPDRGTLKGWLRSADVLNPIPTMPGWVSPCLGIRFELKDKELHLYRPDGESFATYLEMVARTERAELAKERERLAKERTQAEQAQAEQAQAQAEQAQRDAIPKLLAMGLSVEQIAQVLSLPVEVVRDVAQS